MSIHEKNDFDIRNYDHMAVKMQNPNFNNDWQNFSGSVSLTEEEEDYFYQQNDGLNSLPGLKGILYAIYISIFFIGICGNVLVCYVVFCNKSLHTVTNFFITNLALSNILLCTFAVPFTSIYLFLSKWVFGRVLCHLVPYFEGASVYITAFTFISIAIDRYLVTMYPLKPRLQLTSSYIIILSVWILAGLLILPNGIFMVLVPTENGIYCDEVWPHESSRKAFVVLTLILQFVMPFIIIIFCYLNVCIDIKKHARSIPRAESFEKDEMERESTRQINRMLIIMAIIFYTSWLPLNIYILTLDFITFNSWKYLNVIFLIFHAAAMSSSCYNPFLYAWLNENFRKEFMIAFSCFKSRFQDDNTMSMKEIRSKKTLATKANGIIDVDTEMV